MNMLVCSYMHTEGDMLPYIRILMQSMFSVFCFFFCYYHQKIYKFANVCMSVGNMKAC